LGLGGDQTAGAGNALAVAAAEIDFRNPDASSRTPEALDTLWESGGASDVPLLLELSRPLQKSSEIPGKSGFWSARGKRQRATRGSWLPDLCAIALWRAALHLVTAGGRLSRFGRA
jgi:hypothetical protein